MLPMRVLVLLPLLTVLLPFALTSLNENLRARRRRRSLASAFVLELRTYRRHASGLQEMATRATEKDYDLGIGFSRHLYETLLGELPLLGSDQFLHLRATYQQLAQVNYLVEKFAEPVPDFGLGREAQDRLADHHEEIASAYVPALSIAITRIDAALESLRAVAPSDVFDAPLPAITEVG